jgi:Holliday junction resolvase-like predicted endonuclease
MLVNFIKRRYKNFSILFGKIAEFQAIFFLLFFKFLFPIKLRYKAQGGGEIDIIATHIFIKKIAFIEVKNRNSKENLFESISNNQINRILISSRIFLKTNKKYMDHKIVFLGVYFYNLRFQKILNIDIDLDLKNNKYYNSRYNF